MTRDSSSRRAKCPGADTAAAARLRCPTLVLASEFDRMTPPRQAAELVEAIKGARFIACRPPATC